MEAAHKLQFEAVFDHEVVGITMTSKTGTLFRAALEEPQKTAAYVLISNGEEFMIWSTSSAVWTECRQLFDNKSSLSVPYTSLLTHFSWCPKNMMLSSPNTRACAEQVERMNFITYWLHIGRVWVTHCLSNCQSHNFVFECILVVAIHAHTGVVRNDAVIRQVRLHNMCDGIQDWMLCWHPCLVMSSLLRDYFSSCRKKVLCAEHHLFEDSLVPNHCICFWTNLVLDK